MLPAVLGFRPSDLALEMMTDEACQGCKPGDCNFFMSSSKNPMSFAYHIYRFKRPLGLGLTFDAAERNRKFVCIQCQRNKESSSSRGEKARSISLLKYSEKQSKKKSHSNKLSENWRNRAVCWGGTVEKGLHLVELAGDQNPSPKAPSRCKRGRRKGNARRNVTSRGAIERVGVLGPLRERRSKEVTQLNREEERMEVEKDSVLLSVKEEEIGKA